MDVRQESDLLGTREIENSLYYGVHTLRAIENFKISDRVVNDMPELIRGMVLVKKAVALTNKELRVVDPKIVDAIVAACDQVLSTGKCMDQFPVDCFQGGAGTSTNMNTNEVIANIALEILGYPKGTYSIVNPNDHVNESQSTNDAYPTGIRLALYKMTHDLIGAIDYLKEGLLEKADEFKDVLKMGRTQLQDAVPMLLGQEFNAFASLLTNESKELGETAQKLLTVNLGATAIGTGVNTPVDFQPVAIKYLSEVTGYSCKGATDLLAATYDCSDFVTLHSGLKRAAIRLSKICNDLRLLASGPRTGLKEINLPELQAGSSIMPAKVNPVLPEVVNQACFKVMGNDVTVMMAADAGQLQLNVMEPVIAQSLFESIQLLKNSCISLRDKCIDGITVNDARCLNDVTGSIAIITYLSPIIGHHEGDIVGKICAQTGRSIQEVVIERGLMTKEALDELFSVENLKKPRYTPTRF